VSQLWLTKGHYPDWIAEDVMTLRDCQRYHCLPSELDDEDWHVISRHRAIEAAENKYLENERRVQEQKQRRRR